MARLINKIHTLLHVLKNAYIVYIYIWETELDI